MADVVRKVKYASFFSDSFFRELMESFYFKNYRYGEHLVYQLYKEKIIGS